MSDETPKPDGRGKSPGSLGALRPPKEGEPPRNPKGTNGWDERRKVLLKFLDGKSADPEKTRIEKVMLATYTNSLTPKGGMDRKLLNEQYFGKAREQIDLTNDDKSLSGASAAVAFVDLVVAAALEKLRKPDDEGGGGTPAG